MELPIDLEEIRLDQVINAAWSLLKQGAKISTHPCHTPVLSTLDQDFPESRVVVLRVAQSSSATLECHTDKRSGKIAQIERNPNVAWTFYDPNKKLQVRARGTATIHANDSYAHGRWKKMSDQSKRCYAQPLPAGLPVDKIENAAPCPNATDAEVGRQNFAIVCSQIEQLEWLYLSSAGHQRALCKRTEESWSCQWIMP